MLLWEEWQELYAQVERPDAAQAARRFFEERRAEMEAGAQLLWPEREDLYALMCLRAEGGASAFDREKQGLPASDDLCEWPEAYFGGHIWFAAWPAELLIKTMALDPSKGAGDRRGDYSALVLLGMDQGGLIYVEGDLARRPTPQMIADGVELYRRFQPAAFCIETNQYQELLGGEFEREFQRRGLYGASVWSMVNRANKRVRIRRLGPLLAARRLRFKLDSPSTRLLVEQLRAFPAGDHDDGPDALEMAWRLAEELLAGRAAPFEVSGRLITSA
jgi:predicted phage terminase large subunit-like protein